LWRFLLRFRVILWLLRLVIVPLFVFVTLIFLFILIAGSLYGLLVAKTVAKAWESPYIFVPLLLMEILALLGVSYMVMVYISKIWKYKNTGGR